MITGLLKSIAAISIAVTAPLATLASDKEVRIRNHNDGITLAGTLTVPDSITPKAALVLSLIHI